MDYIGEHLLPGRLGHFFIVLSLVASLVATFCYFMATRSGDRLDGNQWKKLARYAFITETISVFAIFSILFYIIYNHLFEYKYAWQHSSRSLEVKYLLACFWEGQEGSFLLWSIWHCLIGLVLMRTGKKWEVPVMTVVSLAQFCLATMLTGIYFFGWKMGSNPFILLRESGVLDNAPALHVAMDVTQPIRPDYLTTIRDGNDLNPLLQNYWMVIHPPVLFLGFASTIVPFAYAVAGLWKKQFDTPVTTSWTNAALPWSLFSAAVFGTGIMMGAAWAYESLTFGGYWAWDPVENASLVPWMILIAGIHTLLIYKHSGHSLRSTYLFFILAFVFVLYSTFLTRSGILGESSVHAFTDLGMNAQLYLLLYVFIWGTAALGARGFNQKIITLAIAAVLALAASLFPVPAIGFFALLLGIAAIVYQVQTQVPTVQKEESGSSREFWMFIGSLVFFLSALLIIGKTSLPVFNKLFGWKQAPPEDAEFAYNNIQIYVAIILGLLTDVTQYLRYKATPARIFWKKAGIPILLSVIVAVLVLAFGNINYRTHGPGFLGAIWLAIACSIYTVLANAAYIWIGLKGKLALSGGSVSHFGFGLVLLGILVSSSKKEILSYNTSGISIPFAEESEEKTGENLTLVKGFPMKMGKYDVTYITDSAHPKKQQWYFKIHFKSREDKEEFTLFPNAFINYKGNEGLMANPDSRHYWDHDVFTYVSALPDPGKNTDTTSFRSQGWKQEGDSIFYSRGFIILEKLATGNNLPVPAVQPGDKGTIASLRVHSSRGNSYPSQLLFLEQDGGTSSQPDTVMAESLVLRIDSVQGNRADISIRESGSVLKYVTLKAYKFPFIRILWAGIIITAIGILISMVRRIQLNRQQKEVKKTLAPGKFV